MLNTIKTQFKQIFNDTLGDYQSEIPDDVETQLIDQLQQCVIDNMPKSRKGRKPKKPVDTNAPKKPLTAYLSFSNDNRQSIKAELQAENPGAKISVTDVSKILGQKWKELETENPVEYNAYKDKATTLSNQYKTALASYYDSDGYKEFIESEEYIEWKEFAEKEKEEKKKAPKKVANKPFVFKPVPDEKLKSVLQLAKNKFLVDYIKLYQEQIDDDETELTLADVKKRFSAMIKQHSLVKNKTSHINDDDLFSTDTTYQDLFEELSEIKKQFAPTPDPEPVEEVDDDNDDLITDDEEEQSGCQHLFTKGQNKGRICGKTCVEGSEYCRGHNNK